MLSTWQIKYSNSVHIDSMADQQIEKFNTLMNTFLTDLSATVPDVPSVAEAKGWLTALISVDPANDKLLRLFMKMLGGSQEFIDSKDPTIFQNFSCMPSLISQEDMWNIFRSLSDADRKVCWRYLSKLYSSGKKALIEMGEFEEVECSGAQIKAQLGDMMSPLQSMLAGGAGSSADDLASIQMPEGAIVQKAFNAMVVDLLSTLTALLPGDAALAETQTRVDAVLVEEGTDSTSLFKEYDAQFPAALSQGLISTTEAVVRQHGIPFLAGSGKRATSILDSLDSTTDRESLLQTIMQLGTISVALQQLDAEMLGSVEEMARNFMGLIQKGEIDMSQFAENPFQMLEKLASSGLCDNLLELIAKQQQPQ